MKKIVYYILGVAALLAAASCQKNPFEKEGVSSEGFTLTFSCGDMATRADELQVSNEKLIKRIDYFIFPCDEDGVVANDAVAAYRGEIVPTDGGLAGSYSTGDLTTGALNKIFPNGATKAVVFAVANFVDFYGSAVEEPNTTIPDGLTWADLQALEVGQSFFKDGGEGFELRWPRVMQANDKDLFFVMVGQEVVELKNSGKYAIDAQIELKRLASKVTAKFTYAEEVIELDKDGDPKVRWVPQQMDKETKVYLSNGIEHSSLGGPLTRKLDNSDSWKTCTKPNVHNGTVADGSRDVFEYAYDYMTDLVAEYGDDLAHYYTYPISMEEGDDNQPYLKLVLPWIGYNYLYTDEGGTAHFSQEATKMKEVYYKIVLPRETIKDPNMIYEFEVYVDIVGSDKEVNITGEKYVVKDWSKDKAISSNVGMGKYISLDIPKDYYDMYSDSTKILYVSSGEVVISKLQIYKMDLSGSTPVEYYYANDLDGTYPVDYTRPNETDRLGRRASNWVYTEDSRLVVNHAMRTDITVNTVDISPYTFVITLHLKDEGTNPRFDRTVTVTQYPPIYVLTDDTTEGRRNTVFLNSTPHLGNNNVRVNNENGESIGVIGQNSMNTSRIKPIITVTTLSGLDLTKYDAQGIDTPVIGDPRITLAEKLPVSTYNQGQSWGNDDFPSIPTDYQYTDVAKSNVIAPRFLLSSGYGSCAVNKVDWIHNVQRCAAYQEDGYPAGRWRLPTEAEVLFVYTLGYNLRLIDNPFHPDSRYWANSGRFYYHSDFSSGGTTNPGSRCVYDLWYWGDQKYDNNKNPLPDNSATNQIATQWLGFMTTK